LHEEKQLTHHQTKYDYLKHRIQALMKDAEKAIFSNGCDMEKIKGQCGTGSKGIITGTA
jgi:hypothetical protein